MDVHAIQIFLSTAVTELVFKILAAMVFRVVGRWLIGKVIAVMQAGRHA